MFECSQCNSTGALYVPKGSYGVDVEWCTACYGGERVWTRSAELSKFNPHEVTDGQTIENFVVRDDATRQMRAAAERFVNEPCGWLMLHGRGTGRANRGVGCWGAGKTHLARAITVALLRRGIPAVYMKLPQLLAYIGVIWRQENDRTDYADRLAWCQRVAVLIVDEVDKTSQTPAAENHLLNLLDARYEAAIRGIGGATVLTSNTHPDYWHDPAIADRVMSQRFVQVQVTHVSYRRTPS